MYYFSEVVFILRYANFIRHIFYVRYLLEYFEIYIMRQIDSTVDELVLLPFYDIVSSPMNYIGGKYKLLPQILPMIPKNINVFVDLFCGGCNVGINVEANRIIFNDNLTYLIDLYRLLYSLPKDEILNHIRNRILEFGLSLTNNEGYVLLRDLYNTKRNPLDLFVLVAFSFNHQIRFNSAHEFNNPFGKKRSAYNSRMEKNLIAFINKLQSRDVSFLCFNFDEFDFSGLSINDYVYCDPPYLITTGSYNDGKRGFTGWNRFHELKLLAILDELNTRGVRFSLSNVLKHKGRCNTVLCDWLDSRDYYVHHLCKDYSNSSYNLKNRCDTETDEVLITNYTC